MGTGNYTDQVKPDAVGQITKRGYPPVKEVSERLGVSLHPLYAWRRRFGRTTAGDTEKDAEIRGLCETAQRDAAQPGRHGRKSMCPKYLRQDRSSGALRCAVDFHWFS
jgi:transposase